MYFLDVMTFDPTLTTSTMVNTELEWAFHGFKGFANKIFLKNASLLWKWVGGSRSHSEFFLNIIPK